MWSFNHIYYSDYITLNVSRKSYQTTLFFLLYFKMSVGKREQLQPKKKLVAIHWSNVSYKKNNLFTVENKIRKHAVR